MCDIGKVLRVFASIPKPLPMRRIHKVETPEPEREMVPVRRIKKNDTESQRTANH